MIWESPFDSDGKGNALVRGMLGSSVSEAAARSSLPGFVGNSVFQFYKAWGNHNAGMESMLQTDRFAKTYGLENPYCDKED